MTSSADWATLIESHTRELELAESKYRQLTNNLPVGIYRLNKNGDIEFVNQTLLNIFGFSTLEELRNCPDTTVIPSLEQRLHYIERLQTKNGVVERELLLLRKDHTPLNILHRGQIHRDAHGDFLYIDGIMEDITAHKLTEQTLRESEEKYRQLFNTKLEAVCVVDTETGHILDANQAWEDLYGYTLADALATRLTLTDISSEPDKTHAVVQRTNQSNDAVRIPIRWHKDRSGRIFPVEAYAGTFIWKGRRIMCASMRDISDRQQGEQQRLKLALEQERSHMLADFITQTSHQFRTPLSVIASSSYLLSKLRDPEQIATYLQNVQDEVEHINQLVSSMLLMTQFNQNINEEAYHWLSINDVVESASNAMKPHFIQQDITYSQILCDSSSQIYGNGHYLRQVLGHVLQNALQYTPAGGHIHVQTWCQPKAIILEVRDTGSGIEEDDLPRVFDQFYRGANNTASRGFGLGLTIARRVIEMHHGTITLHNAPEGGTIARIMLPVTQPQS